MSSVLSSPGREQRAMSMAAAPMLGETLEDFVIIGLSRVSPVRREATVLRTETGEAVEVPVVEDNEEADVHAENGTTVCADIAIASMPLGAHLYDSGHLRVSKELYDDGGLAARRTFGKVLAGRIGRKANRHFTVGTGSGQPTGIVTASTLGETTAAADEITCEELLNLLHSAPDIYQYEAGFMMSLDTLRVVRTLADGNGQPAYYRGLLFDKRVVINQAMPAIAPGAMPILYGDLSLYHVREVGSVEVRYAMQRFVEYGQIGIAATLRADGNLVDVNAVKHLLMAD